MLAGSDGTFGPALKPAELDCEAMTPDERAASVKAPVPPCNLRVDAKYTPTLLNGVPVPVVLATTVQFAPQFQGNDS